MAFNKRKIIKTIGGVVNTGAKCSLSKRGEKPAIMGFTLLEEKLKEFGYADGDKFDIYFGDKERHGIVRLVPAEDGDLEVAYRRAKKGVGFWRFNVGYQPDYVNRPEKADQINIEKLENGDIEMVLPPWADDTKPSAEQVGRQNHKAAIEAAKAAIPASKLRTGRV